MYTQRNHKTLDFNNFKNYPLIFYGLFKFLSNPLYTVFDALFLWMTARVLTLV
jgi:hypothetical protein